MIPGIHGECCAISSLVIWDDEKEMLVMEKEDDSGLPRSSTVCKQLIGAPYPLHER